MFFKFLLLIKLTSSELLYIDETSSGWHLQPLQDIINTHNLPLNTTKLSSYGCWCGNIVHGGKPTSKLDILCQQLHQCLKCINLDSECSKVNYWLIDYEKRPLIPSSISLQCENNYDPCSTQKCECTEYAFTQIFNLVKSEKIEINEIESKCQHEKKVLMEPILETVASTTLSTTPTSMATTLKQKSKSIIPAIVEKTQTFVKNLVTKDEDQLLFATDEVESELSYNDIMGLFGKRSSSKDELINELESMLDEDEDDYLYTTFLTDYESEEEELDNGSSDILNAVKSIFQEQVKTEQESTKSEKNIHQISISTTSPTPQPDSKAQKILNLIDNVITHTTPATTTPTTTEVMTTKAPHILFPDADTCCGTHPKRFPFNSSKGSRSCCKDKTFDVLNLKCCPNGETVSITNDCSSALKFKCKNNEILTTVGGVKICQPISDPCISTTSCKFTVAPMCDPTARLVSYDMDNCCKFYYCAPYKRFQGENCPIHLKNICPPEPKCGKFQLKTTLLDSFTDCCPKAKCICDYNQCPGEHEKKIKMEKCKADGKKLISFISEDGCCYEYDCV